MVPESVQVLRHLRFGVVICRISGEEFCTWSPMLSGCRTGKTPSKTKTACTNVIVAIRIVGTSQDVLSFSLSATLQAPERR